MGVTLQRGKRSRDKIIYPSGAFEMDDDGCWMVGGGNDDNRTAKRSDTHTQRETLLLIFAIYRLYRLTL